MPLEIRKLLIPIFRDLSDSKLLSKCLHGQTQNANESLNNVIWKKCPKDVYISKKLLNLEFIQQLLNLMMQNWFETDFSKVRYSDWTLHDDSFQKCDFERIGMMLRKSSNKGKADRKHLRAVRKGFIDSEKENEKTPAYLAGAF